MRRRGGIPPSEQLDNIYYNMKAELQIYIKRSHIDTVESLIQEVETYEKLKGDAKKMSITKETLTVDSPNNPFNRKDHRWNCKQRGHSRANCKNLCRKFCSVCGKDNVLTRNCHGPKNETKTEKPSTRVSKNQT
ncbi:hypothetical protein TKK_0019075 [Trichogramma kaykai]|uniref:Uncharacterized protein n=1 Tax=Trichogramma kaykai TaxID=54128 RepID=A0ABD2VUP2_9HYME